jgi:23S rRNA pseudouridine1911/1915/1917 synthase
MEIEILYEDNHLIAVNKPAGTLSQGDKTGDDPLGEEVKKYIKIKYNKPGEVFLGVIHRLDRPVSGVILFARTSKALSRMNELFQEKKFQKTYWAITKNRPHDAERTLIHYLIKNEKNNTSKAYNKEIKGSKRAELSYKIVAQLDNYIGIAVKPATGRHHQIRVQLASIGCPIKGDLKYGFDRSNSDGSIHLHAREARFTHPVSKEELVITAPPPKDAIWQALLQKIESSVD